LNYNYSFEPYPQSSASVHSSKLWTEALDCGYGLDILYLDYRKAFDTVPHRRLLLKLQGYGISDNYIKWISSFLTSRMMRVGVSGEFSQWVEVVSSVPQGSVLGPLLFILYVNDLPNGLKIVCGCLPMMLKSGPELIHRRTV